MIEIPGYSIEKQLGRGGMARVYLARHIGLDRLVAIKVLSKDLDGDRSFSERFMREARIVANLTHQNIITVYDIGVHDEHHYIAMEYLPGETLDDKIKKKQDIQPILSITKQIASALDFAHKKGIVHRDVKPDNILFREDGTAVLTDFGIARAARSETRMTATGTVIGTPHYMSPEQAQGQEIGPWSDIYSLGIVFYEMLTGEVPFDADSTIAVVFKHITEPVPELDEPYTQYQALINTMLAKEPAARYQTGREVIADIECLDRGDTPANATLIFNQTAINPATSLNTAQTSQITARPDKSAGGKLKIFSALTFLGIIVAVGILFFPDLNTKNPAVTSNTQQTLKPADRKQAMRNQQLELDRLKTQKALLKKQRFEKEKQAIEKRQRELDKLEAQKALSKKHRLEKEKQEQVATEKALLRHEYDTRIAREKQAKARAETEARKAREELRILKQKQLAAQDKEAHPPESGTAAHIIEQKIIEKAPPKPQKTGLLAGWMGSVDDHSDEYINDLFKAADTALSNKRYASASQNYEKILQLSPDNNRARQGLAIIAQQNTKTAPTSSYDAYTRDLLKAAGNALKANRLSSASVNYKKILQRAPENKQAIKGLNTVFDRHLRLAIEKARDDDFDEAEEHFLAAKELKPNHDKLNTVHRELVQLKNAR